MTTESYVASEPPAGLSARGQRLWLDMSELADLNGAEQVLLHEACRIADRLDQLDALLTGGIDTWVDLRDLKGRPDAVEVHMDNALSESRQQANVLKQLIASLRLPEAEGGKRPQQRGGARGAYKPRPASTAKVSSLDRARERKVSGG